MEDKDLIKMKMIDYRKMLFKTFIRNCEEQFLKKNKRNFNSIELEGMKILFFVLRLENDIKYQINYFYFDCISKPINEDLILNYFQDYDEFFFDEQWLETEDDIESSKLYNKELKKFNKIIFKVIEILKVIDISKFDKKYETEFEVPKYLYLQLINNFRHNN